jgi:hypothetical protein
MEASGQLHAAASFPPVASMCVMNVWNQMTKVFQTERPSSLYLSRRGTLCVPGFVVHVRTFWWVNASWTYVTATDQYERRGLVVSISVGLGLKSEIGRLHLRFRTFTNADWQMEPLSSAHFQVYRSK